MEWETSSKCSLCKLFASVMPSDPNEIVGYRRVSFKLYAFPRNVALGGIIPLIGVARAEDWDILEMQMPSRKHGYLGCSPPDDLSGGFGVRQICPELFSVDFARDCIAHCQKKHGGSCEQAREPKVAPFFRVIDCKTRAIIVAPPGCSYAALSYVWEAVPASQAMSGRSSRPVLDNCSKVIRDSIEVALKINLQYLWVDQYCIDQSNAQDKHNQVRQMDFIYANAQVTIIAAQVKVEGTGLPGVTETRRYRPSCTIRGRLIAPVLLDSRNSVKESKWATRGWTYQEGILSKRRLIFTDHQVFFECNGLECAEPLTLPLHSKHDERRKALEERVTYSRFGPGPPNIDPYKIIDHICQFSTRELTFQEDRLNAMSGIFRMLEGDRLPVYQFMGVPIMPPWYQNPSSHEIVYKKLQRTLEQGFLIGLTWQHEELGKKITHFPTWSWAGWTGEIDHDLAFKRHWNTSPKDARVFIELKDGSLSRFPIVEALSSLESNEPLNNTKFIHVEAKTFSCSTVRSQEIPPESERIFFNSVPCTVTQIVRLVVEEGTEFYFHAILDRQLEEDELSSKMLTGILVGDLSINWTWNRLDECHVAIIFVEELNGHAERWAVGSFRLFGAALYTENKWAHLTPEFVLESSKKFLKHRKIRIG